MLWLLLHHGHRKGEGTAAWASADSITCISFLTIPAVCPITPSRRLNTQGCAFTVRHVLSIQVSVPLILCMPRISRHSHAQDA